MTSTSYTDFDSWKTNAEGQGLKPVKLKAGHWQANDAHGTPKAEFLGKTGYIHDAGSPDPVKNTFPGDAVPSVNVTDGRTERQVPVANQVPDSSKPPY